MGACATDAALPLAVSNQSQWGRRYQEEELRSLKSELDTASREVEAETKQLRDREEIIRSIRDEQQQVYNITLAYVK